MDLPTAVRPDAAPSLPDLPPYLAAAAARAPAAPTTAPASRGARNALQFVIDRCHARLPWIRCGAAGMGVGGWPPELQWEALHWFTDGLQPAASIAAWLIPPPLHPLPTLCSCQYQQPSEAQVLKAARSTWQAAAQQQQKAAPVQPASSQADMLAGPAAPAAPPQPTAAANGGSAGPLLLFPDTSALLPMLGAAERVAIPTFFTLDLLEGLAKAGRFGRGLPPQEQVRGLGWRGGSCTRLSQYVCVPKYKSRQ